LTIYFGSDRLKQGQYQLYTATRTSATKTFEPPALIAELVSQEGGNVSPTVTPDGLTMYFESTRTGLHQILQVTRDAVTSPWSPPMLVDRIVMKEEGGPYALPGGVLYFHSTGPGDLDIFRADSTEVRDLANVNVGPDDQRPVVTEDELTMYFGASRPDP